MAETLGALSLSPPCVSTVGCFGSETKGKEPCCCAKESVVESNTDIVHSNCESGAGPLGGEKKKAETS